jgi:hypothetical protein
MAAPRTETANRRETPECPAALVATMGHMTTTVHEAQYLSVAEVALTLGVSAATVRRKLRAATCRRSGSAVRAPPSASRERGLTPGSPRTARRTATMPRKPSAHAQLDELRQEGVNQRMKARDLNAALEAAQVAVEEASRAVTDAYAAEDAKLAQQRRNQLQTARGEGRRPGAPSRGGAAASRACAAGR